MTTMKINRPISSSNRSRSRSGLAPLELVLNLPLMMFVVGLMIVFTFGAVWKVKTVVNARESQWRVMRPRNGNTNDAPRGWRATEKLGTKNDGPPVFAFDPIMDQTVARGPMLVETESGNTIPIPVNDRVFDFQSGLRHGYAHFKEPLPMFTKVRPEGVDLLREHPVIDNRWQYWSIGLGSNNQRRIPLLFLTEIENHVPGEASDYVQAAIDVLQSPDNEDLETLDNDDELKQPYPRGFGRAPDFHLPGNGGTRRDLTDWNRMAENDPAIIRDKLAEELLERLVVEIRGTFKGTRRSLTDAGVPGKVTQAFLRMYRQQVAAREAEIEALRQRRIDISTNASPTAAEQEELKGIGPKITKLETEQTPIREKIRELEVFGRRLGVKNP